MARGGSNNNKGSQTGSMTQERIQDPDTHTEDTPIGNGNGVGQELQELLEITNTDETIGEQVKTIVQEQIKTQARIHNQLGKLEQKGNLLKLIFGQSKDTINELNQYINQNQEKIDQLKTLKEQITDTEEIASIESTITSLLEQNENLQNKIQTEEFSGIVGWFKKVFKFE